MVKKSIAAVSVALMVHGMNAAAAAAASPGPADTGSTCSCATTTPPVPAGTWAAAGQLGLIVTSGDTTTKSGNAAFNAAHVMGRWTVSGGLAALYASTNGYSTQQDTNATLQADYALTKSTFWFSSARWDRNLFTGFDYQDSVATGAGYNFVATPATQLSGELGVGYRIEDPEILTTGPAGNVTSREHIPGSMQRDAVLQAGVNYSHAITKLTKITNTLLVQYGSNDTVTTDALALTVNVDASLSLAVGMQLVNNTSPPPGSAKHTDTVMTVNLVYALKNPNLSPTATAPVNVTGFNLP
jgi:putative salt-induced outer membrane protein